VLKDEAAELFASHDPATPDSFGLFQVLTSKAMNPGRAFIASATPEPRDEADLFRAFQFNHYGMADLVRAARKTGLVAIDFGDQAATVPHDNTTRSKPTMENLAAMRRTIEVMLTQFRDMAARIERFGGEPEIGTVIKFEHTFRRSSLVLADEMTYTYVAFRADNGLWYTTGKPKYGPIAWDELLTFIGDGRAWVLTEEREVPVPNLTPVTIEASAGEATSRNDGFLYVGDEYAPDPEAPPATVDEFDGPDGLTLSRAEGEGEEGLWLWEHPEDGVLFSGPMPWKLAVIQNPKLRIRRFVS
jgi:hypothetical protein